MKDPFTGMYPKAQAKDWIKDMSMQKRGLGLVKTICAETEGMQVWWPKSGKTAWVVLNNYGHYRVI